MTIMSLTDLRKNTTRDNTVLPKAVLRNIFAHRDTFLTVAAFIKAMNMQDQVGQKFIDAAIELNLTPEEVEGRLKQMEVILALNGVLGTQATDPLRAIGWLVMTYGGELFVEETSDNLTNILTSMGDFDRGQALMRLKTINALTGDWGEVGDVD